MILKECSEDIIDHVITSGIEVHRELGSGLLESIYEQALAYELYEKGIVAQRQVEIPAIYTGQDLGIGFRADIVVESCLLLEIKQSIKFWIYILRS